MYFNKGSFNFIFSIQPVLGVCAGRMWMDGHFLGLFSTRGKRWNTSWLTLSHLQQDHQLHLSNMPSKTFYYKGMTGKILSFKKCNIQEKKVTKLYFLMFSSFHIT